MADEREEPVELPPPPSFQAVLVQFLKQLATVSTDLHQLTCPAIMLNGVSLLEYGKHWGDHPELFASISDGETPEERLKAVVRWFFSTLYGSYVGRTAKAGSFERKPYNPILGEQFSCQWPNEAIGTTKLLSEQVSHHPPVAGFQLINKKAGVYLNGHCGQKTRFTGTAIQVEQTGCLFVFLERWGEEYAISLPELYLRGLVTGAPFVEITGETLIVCSRHPVAAKVRFIPKPWFSGEYNLVEGILYNDTTKEVSHEIWGKWSEKTFIQIKAKDPEDTHLANIESGIVDQDDPEAEILFDAISKDIQHPRITSQSPLDSREIWKPVTEALVKGDFERASKAKNDIEEEQRALRKERAANGIQWLPMHFTFIPEFFLTKNYDIELGSIVGPNISTESLIRLKNLDLNSSNKSLSSSSDSVASASSDGGQQALERKAVETIKFNGRWVAYEFLDLVESKK